MTFSQKTLHYIHPGSKVLDLGAGDGRFSRECAGLQASVTAIDVKPATTPDPNIDWQTMKVEDFVERLPKTEMFDVIFSRNLIQFLDSTWIQETFFPTLLEHLQPHGVLAIQTFYRDPEPPFESKVSSLFTPDLLRGMLLPLKVVHERQFSETSPDMKGIQRMFYVTNLIAQKA